MKHVLFSPITLIYSILFMGLSATCIAETKTLEELKNFCDLKSHVLISGNFENGITKGKESHLLFDISQPIEGGQELYYCKTDLKHDYVDEDGTEYTNQNDCNIINKLNQIDEKITVNISLKETELDGTTPWKEVTSNRSYGVICGKPIGRENVVSDEDRYKGIHFVHQAKENKASSNEDGFVAYLVNGNYTLLNKSTKW